MMTDLICEAIRQRKIISFYYEGGKRIVEPYTFGYDRKDKPKLRAYQIKGYSSSGKPEGWKLFEVDKVSDIHILNETFTVRPEYNWSGDKHIPDIICKV